jgi:hypothetical protein
MSDEEKKKGGGIAKIVGAVCGTVLAPSSSAS